ncbi:MAG: sorbosone dehydrogenase, partial [Bacteroidota bacterium]|nr:sorbosone dehydrogenase [Bacteroidota bacterium]
MNEKIRGACLAAIAFAACLYSCNNNRTTTETKNSSVLKSDLKLPAGFSSSIVADSLGHLRHIVVNTNGDVYVSLSALKDGKGVYLLKDTDKDGTLDLKTGFANYPGTGIAIKNGYLYSASNT